MPLRPSWEHQPHYGLWSRVTSTWVLDCFDEPQTFPTRKDGESYLKLFNEAVRDQYEIRDRPSVTDVDGIVTLRKKLEAATAGPWFIEGAHMDYAIKGNQTGSKDGWAIADNVFDLDARRQDAERQARDADLVIALRNAAAYLLDLAELGVAARQLLREHGARISELTAGEPAGNAFDRLFVAARMPLPPETAERHERWGRRKEEP